MPVWEIIGPVMVGPSSSHTAGAAHIGRIVRMCWGGEIKKAALYMRGSFASTGAGHGTDKALVAGLMGMAQDDPGIRRAFELAREAGMEFEFHIEEVAGAHPNSVRVVVEGDRQLHYGSWKRGTLTLLVGELEHAAHGFEAELAAVVGLGVHAVAQREKTKQIPLEGLGEGRAGEDVLVERGHDAGILRTRR